MGSFAHKSVGYRRRRGTGLLVATLVIAMMVAATVAPAPASAAVAFTDTATSLNADAIVRLASLGVITGYGGGLFKPDNNITRTEFAALIVRALGLEATAKGVSTKPRFSDVSTSYKWAYGYITLASDRGIIKGDPDGRFRPADNVTAGEAVTMIIRALGREPLIDKDAKWPDGHVAMAQMLGLGDARAVKTAKASRGAIAGYLDAAFTQNIVQVGVDGAVTDTHTSFLSLQKATRYEGKVQAAGAGIPAHVDFADDTVVPADADSAYDSIEVAADATVCGIASIAELTGMYAEVIVRDGKAIFVAPIFLTVGEVRTAEQPKLTLTSGNSYTIADEAPVTFNGWSVGGMKDCWPYFGPGSTVRIEFDATGNTILAVHLLRDVNGSLYWTGREYYLDTDDGLFSLFPGDPSSMLTSDTEILLNGEDVNEVFLRRDVSDPDTLVSATLYLDPATGKGDVLSVAVYDSQATFCQPLLEVSGNTITVPVGGDDNLYAATYNVSPDVGIWADGDWQELSYLEPGDYVSFRTDGEQVTYIAADADVDQPQMLESNWVTNETQYFSIYVDEALVPSSVKVTVDGSAYSKTSLDIGDGFASSNSFWLYYREGMTFDEGRQLIILYAAGGFADGLHDVTIEGRDFADNRLSTSAKFLIDTRPATAALSSASPDGKTVKIQFTDDMLVSSVEDAAKWVCSALPGNIKSVAYDENTAIATVTLNSAQPGATLTAALEDLAGNSVAVSVVLP